MTETARILRFPVERTQAKRLVPLRELRDQFGYSERWWRHRLSEGLPHRAWGGQHRFDPDEVRDWLDARYGT